MNYNKINKSAALYFTYFAKFYIYFALGSVRSEGGVGEMDLSKYLFSPKMIQFQHENISDFNSFFSWKYPMPYTIMVHNRFCFHLLNHSREPTFCF